MKDVLTINRSKWRTGGDDVNKTGKGGTALLNKEGSMCCLGFRLNQIGIPRKQLLNKGQPSELGQDWIIPDLVTIKTIVIASFVK